MGIIKLIKQPAEKIIKEKLDKVLKKVLSGAKDSPYKNVDDTGTFPLFRNPDDLPGTEKKKLKKAGEKIAEEFRKQDKAKKIKELQMGGTKMGYKFGGRAGYKSGTRGCKLAMRGKGRAYGKNS